MQSVDGMVDAGLGCCYVMLHPEEWSVQSVDGCMVDAGLLLCNVTS